MARNAVRATPQTSPEKTADIIIEIAGGRYELQEPFYLDSSDSGSPESRITYKAKTGETPELIGGKTLTRWHHVRSPETLARLRPVARNNVLQASLTELGIIPNEREASKKWNQWKPGIELFLQNTPLQLARWPNAGFTKIANVRDQNNNDGNYTATGIFTYYGIQPNDWTPDEKVFAHGFWSNDWADQRFRVASIDKETKTVRLSESAKHPFGYRAGQRYYFYNVLTELDQPGEWYIDDATGDVYYWPPECVDALSPIASTLDNIIVLDNATHITLQGLTLSGSQDRAIKGNNVNNVLIEACTIRNTGDTAVTIKGKDSGLDGCDLYNLGGGAIILEGGNRETLEAASLFVRNCHIHSYGRNNPVNHPAINVSGVGHTISHNLIHSAPQQAIMWSGNNHLIELNEFFNVVTLTRDAGVLYGGHDPTMRGTIIRHNYIHDVFGFNGHGGVGVYLDDMFCGTTIYGNVFKNVSNAVFIGGGRDNTVENNIFIGCSPALHVDARMLTWASNSRGTMLSFLSNVPYDSAPWSTQYPNLTQYAKEDFAQPSNNLIARNVFWKSSWLEIAQDAIAGVKLVDNLLDNDPRIKGTDSKSFFVSPESPAWRCGFEAIPFDRIGPYNSESRATWPIHYAVRTSPDITLDLSIDSVRTLISIYRPSPNKAAALAIGFLIAWAFIAAHFFFAGSHTRTSRAVHLALSSFCLFLAVALTLSYFQSLVKLPPRKVLWPILAITSLTANAVAITITAFIRSQRSGRFPNTQT